MPHRRNRYFTGREEILARLREALKTSGATALAQAISGLGGVGKTQTAVEYAYRFGDKYDAVFWVNADTEVEIESSFVEIAGKLGFKESESLKGKDLVAIVRNWLARNTNWLLIFDNANTPALLEPYFPESGSGHVLLTSRAHNFVGAGIPHPIEIREMSEAEARAMLLKRTGREGTSGDELEAAVELERELGCLPLALEQAGAYIANGECSFRAYLAAYRKRRVSLLEKARPEAAKYADTVATTWSLNFEVVERESPAAADLLRAAAFLAPETIPSSLVLLGAPELGANLADALDPDDPLSLSDTWRSLRRFSLVRVDDPTAGFSVHRMVQEVVRYQIADEERRSWLSRVMSALLLSFSAKDEAFWPDWTPLIPHAQGVIERCETEGIRSVEVARILNHLGLFFGRRALFATAESQLRKAVELYEILAEEEQTHLAKALNDLGEVLRTQSRLAEAESQLQRAQRIREEKLGSDHPDTASSLNNLGLVHLDRGHYTAAEPLLLRSLGIKQSSLGSDHPDTATALGNLSGLCKAQGRYAEAEPLLRQCLEITQRVLGPEHPNRAMALGSLAGLYQAQGRYAEAEPLLKQSLEIKRRVLGPEHPDTASALGHLAGLYQAQGRYAEAEPLLKQSLEIKRRVLGPEHPDTASALGHLAGLYQAQGRYAEAEPLLKQSLEIKRRVLGPEHPSTVTTLGNLAGLYQAQGQYAEAEPLLKQCLEITQRVLGPEHPNTAIALGNLAGLYQAQGQYAEAEPLLKQCLEITQRVLGPEHPSTATTLGNLAGLYQAQGRYAEAEPLLKQSLEIKRRVLGPEHPNTAIALGNLAGFYADRRNFDRAVRLYGQGLEITRRALPAGHPNSAWILHGLGRVYLEQRRPELAGPLLEEAQEIHEKALGAAHPDTHRTLVLVARLQLQQKNYAEAKETIQRVIEGRKALSGPEDESLIAPFRIMSAALQGEGRVPAAKRYEQDARKLERLHGKRK